MEHSSQMMCKKPLEGPAETLSMEQSSGIPSERTSPLPVEDRKYLDSWAEGPDKRLDGSAGLEI